MTNIRKGSILGSAVGLLVVVLYSFGAFDILELKILDLLFLLRGEREPGDEIVIVAIDEESIGWLSTWPWPRRYHGELIDNLKKAGAKVIGFDIWFGSESTLGPEDDRSLAEAIEKAGNVILGSEVFIEAKEERYHLLIHKPPHDPFLKAAQGIGLVHAVLDRDNFVRRAYVVGRTDDGIIHYSLFFRVLLEYLGFSPEEVRVSSQEVSFGDYCLPVDGEGRMFINYFGGPGTFTTVPYDRVHDGSILERKPDLFKGKIVLVGATVVDLHDLFAAPFAPQPIFPGVETQANAIATVLHRDFIHRSNPLLGCGIVLLLSILSHVVILKVRAMKGLIILLAEISLSLAIPFYLFITRNLWVDTAVPLLTVFLTDYTSGVLCRFYLEEKEKKRIRAIFQRYVAPTVVNEILKDSSQLRLGGEKRELTVFFSDIRGFTPYCEKRSPEEVVRILNEYLEAMTGVIFKYKGTLDKYVGDAIVAIWGAPLPQRDHAELALRAAWEQLEVLKGLQAKWRSEGREPIDIGMGINTGEMVVGNMGSSSHANYTAIGDEVNVGARLEKETRNRGTEENPCHLIISESTYREVGNLARVRELGTVMVKGRSSPVRIYEVLGLNVKEGES